MFIFIGKNRPPKNSPYKDFLIKLSIILLAAVGAYKVFTWLRCLFNFLLHRLSSTVEIFDERHTRGRTHYLKDEFFEKPRHRSRKNRTSRTRKETFSESEVESTKDNETCQDHTRRRVRIKNNCCGKCCGCRGKKSR
jgi:hypothetical protein